MIHDIAIDCPYDFCTHKHRCGEHDCISTLDEGFAAISEWQKTHEWTYFDGWRVIINADSKPPEGFSGCASGHGYAKTCERMAAEWFNDTQEHE